MKEFFEGHEKPIKIPKRSQAKKDADIERCLQSAETLQDSMTQKLMKLVGKRDPLARDAFKVLVLIRTIQFRYYPVKAHSLLRYNDKYFDAKTGIKKAKELQPTKHDWEKWKKIQDRKKLTPLTSFN